jgi:leader peptidase (prepilin peptidase)/N-methyltransferase
MDGPYFPSKNTQKVIMLPEILLLFPAALFGAIVGSFLNVVILRLPDPEQSIVFPASHCPECSASLHWYENIPILSYIFLRGKCGHCKTSISLQYPLVELLMALFSVGVVHTFGLSYESIGYFIFCAALLVIIFIDIRHQIIPDIISLPGIALGFVFSFINSTVTWQSSLIGLLAGGGILYAIALFYMIVRKTEGMGGGDIKLLAMIGAWLGYQSLPFVIMTSSLSGAIIGIILLRSQKKNSNTRIAFGPFLSGAAIIYTFYAKDILYFLNLYLTGQWP